MLTLKHAYVHEIVRTRPGYTEAVVEAGGERARAICYPSLTGDVSPGDDVLINTTAVDMGLGTGGRHFILWNFSQRSTEAPSKGHIMKLRYTPLQIKCLAVEESESGYHEALRDATSIDGMPVIIGTLHSQLPPAVVMLKRFLPGARVAYIMTDGAALPIAFSETAASLKEKRLIDMTITAGHAFGGDLEAVNIFSALAAARYVVKADVAVVCMGPGIAGTGTKLGFSGIEQGQIVNAVNGLKGTAIAIPRITFADKRERHYGISHHTITDLRVAAVTPAVVTLPEIGAEKAAVIETQVSMAALGESHRLERIDAVETIEALREANISPTTMGRGIDEEPEFFMAAGAAAVYAARVVSGGES